MGWGGFLLAAVAAGFAGAVWLAIAALRIATGFFAKQLCSGVFVSGRAAADVVKHDLRAYPPRLIFDYIEWEVDEAAGVVHARWLGLAARRAFFRAGHGSTLDTPPPAAEKTGLNSVSHVPTPTMPAGPMHAVAREQLDAAVAQAFAETDRRQLLRTRAVVVVQGGRIVAERYAPGFHGDMPLPGWSMTKSVFNALVGMLVLDGRLRVDEPVNAPEWNSPGDPRAAITFDHLLRMNTGLAFDETYRSPRSDVNRMLFDAPDAAAYAATKSLQVAPGMRWQYASGTTNILARALRTRFADEREYLAYPRARLFEPLGMRSAIIETDASGVFVGSSYMYASARDWARVGLFFARHGMWNGRRLLPEGWVRYTATPAPGDPNGEYGAHVWLRDLEPGRPPAPDNLPADAFHFFGHGAQRITVMPSLDLVVVRLGHTIERGAWDQERFAAAVAAAFRPCRETGATMDCRVECQQEGFYDV